MKNKIFLILTSAYLIEQYVEEVVSITNGFTPRHMHIAELKNPSIKKFRRRALAALTLAGKICPKKGNHRE
jgi:hypothetical protein